MRANAKLLGRGGAEVNGVEDEGREGGGCANAGGGHLLATPDAEKAREERSGANQKRARGFPIHMHARRACLNACIQLPKAMHA